MKLSVFTGILIIVCLLQVVQVQAEFLKTSSNVFQSRDQITRVIRSEEVAGFFLVQTESVSLPEFDPRNLSSFTSVHCFIEYDRQQNKFSKLRVGTREYRLRGLVRLHLGNLRVTIDNDNPYISFVQNKNKLVPTSAILTFHGMTEAINISGEEAVALFEANQLNNLKGVLEDYTVTKSGLRFKDQLVVNDTIGLSLEVSNPCLSDQALFLRQDVLDQSSKIADSRARKDFLAKEVRHWRQHNPFLSLIRLQTDKNSILVFDYKKVELSKITPLVEMSINQQMCLIERAEISLGANHTKN